jgi:uncharacterized membrane protein
MKKTEKNKIKQLVLCALFSALTFSVTYFIPPIPLPFGYANLGDTVVILSSLIVGGIWGAVAGGLGPALADLFLGYGIYAPATFIIKSLMAFVAYLIFKKAKSVQSKGRYTAFVLLGCIIAELIMAAGYFIFELALYSTGAFASLPGNLLQGVVNAIVSVIIISVLKTNKKFSDMI